MPSEVRSPRLAVLIDADNTSAKIVDGLFEEIAKIGEASVRRIYGDFSHSRSKSWADTLSKHAIIPQPQFAYTTGKNASDITLVIDAMDLLHSGRFDGFLSGFLGQRFHPVGRPYPRARRGRLRIRRAQTSGKLPPGLSKVHLHRDLLAGAAGDRILSRLQASSARERCSPRHREGSHSDGKRGRVGHPSRSADSNLPTWLLTSIPEPTAFAS